MLDFDISPLIPKKGYPRFHVNDCLKLWPQRTLALALTLKDAGLGLGLEGVVLEHIPDPIISIVNVRVRV